jgi:triacylglycerol lipase
MNPQPILLVHGIDDTGVRFKPLQAALLARGLGPVVAMNLIPADASISMQAMAEQVRAAAAALQQETQASKIDLVAFSMGALVARYFLQRLDGRAMVRRFISISGPHQGTLTAYFRRNAGGAQMRPRSGLLQDLSADGNPWEDVEVFSFWSVLDLTILPSVSSRLPRAQNRAFAVMLHPWMLSDQKVIQAVVQTLAA